MSWIVKADVDKGLIADIWNALGEAIKDLKSDTQYLPENIMKEREAEIARLSQALEAGKSAILGGGYRSASQKIHVAGEHQGFTNYETWAMKLWIDNEEGSQNEFRDLCIDAVDREESVEDAIHAAAVMAENIWEDRMPDLGASVFSDLLRASFDEIDWHDVVDSDVKELWEEKPKEEEESGEVKE